MNIKKSHSAVESFPAENRNEGILNGMLLNIQEGGNEEITKDEFVTTSWDLADSKSFRQVPGTNSEIFNVLNKNYREHGEPEFLKRLRSYSNGVSNVISCALQVIFTNNPKFAELSYNDFLNRTGLKDGCFSDQTFLNNKNAFKIISKIKDHDTREKLRNCGVSVVVKFLRISERKDFEALIKKFLSGSAVSRSNAEKYLNSLFPTKKLSVRPAKSGSIAPQAKSTKVDYPNRFGYGGTAVSVLPSEKVMQENDIEELLNNEANPDIFQEEANGYSRESLGVRIDIVGHGQIDAEKIEASFESMREYLSLFVERYAEGEPEWNNIEKLLKYLESHLLNKSNVAQKDSLELADAGSSNIPEKHEDSPKREDTELSANPGLTEIPKNASKDLLLERVSVLMSGFTGKEGLASRQRLVSNITKVIRESGIGYLPKDHPRAMQIAWEIVKNGLDAEKLRGVKSVAELQFLSQRQFQGRRAIMVSEVESAHSKKWEVGNAELKANGLGFAGRGQSPHPSTHPGRYAT